MRELAPDAIGIVDGFFHQQPSVWHREILYALSQGVPVFGGASMGALRAAELADYGMTGVGPDLRGLSGRGLPALSPAPSIPMTKWL